MISVYSGPVLSLVLIHSGLRSIGVSEFLASIRNKRGVDGSEPELTGSRYGSLTPLSVVDYQILGAGAFPLAAKLLLLSRRDQVPSSGLRHLRQQYRTG